MTKFFFVFILSFSIINAAFAQKDSSLYYLKKSGKMVSTADSADYILSITPSDTGTDRNLFVVKERYLNGKIRFISGSLAEKLIPIYPKYPGYVKPVLNGPYTSFFPDGHKMMTCGYDNGDQVGDQTEYYPNGKFYAKKTHLKDKKTILIECRDSTGKVLVVNGNGKWLTFNDERFKNGVEGQVIDGHEEGEWYGKRNDTTNVVYQYKTGKLISMADKDKSGELTYTMLENNPEFPGGLKGFSTFLSENIHYPLVARKKGNTGPGNYKFRN